MSREIWQASCFEQNFTGSEGPFLAPGLVDEATAWELFQQSHHRNFDQFVADRAMTVMSFQEELHDIVPRAHDRLRTGMQLGVDQGFVPAYALDRLAPAFRQTAIQVVDQHLLGEDLAVYQQTTDIMRIGTDAADYDPEQTIIHEIGGHKVSGGTFKLQPDGTITRVRRGFVNHEAGVVESGRHYALDEAIQHHLALSYQYGQFDILDPDMRSDYDTSYYEHRKLLSAFVLCSGGLIDLRAITRSSFEDSDATNTVTTDRRTMVAQARAAYGPGAYFKFNLLSEAIDFEDCTAEELAIHIHGPERASDGRIITPGFIDVPNLSPNFDEIY